MNVFMLKTPLPAKFLLEISIMTLSAFAPTLNFQSKSSPEIPAAINLPTGYVHEELDLSEKRESILNAPLYN